MSLLKRLKEIVDTMEKEESTISEDTEKTQPKSPESAAPKEEKLDVELPNHYLECTEIESSEIILLNHEMRKIKEELANLVYDYEVKKQFLVASNLQKTATIKEHVEKLRLEYGLPKGSYKIEIPDSLDQKQVITFIEVEK